MVTLKICMSYPAVSSAGWSPGVPGSFNKDPGPAVLTKSILPQFKTRGN